MEITSHSANDTKKLAEELAEKLRPGSVLALYGDLGSGKTTFTRYLVEALGIEAKVQSPTFVIFRKYKDENTASKNFSESEITEVVHADFYRIVSKAEVEDLDVDYILKNESGVTVIEWPEILEELLPVNTIKIYFTYLDENSRKINVQNIH